MIKYPMAAVEIPLNTAAYQVGRLEKLKVSKSLVKN